jgi:hypothetical protein
MTNIRTFLLKYIPATNTKPSRLRITDTRFCTSVIISRGDGNQFHDDAITYINKRGIDINFMSWNEKSNETYLHSLNFVTQLKG